MALVDAQGLRIQIKMPHKEMSVKTQLVRNDEGTTKMLLFLQNGEERLITFILPKESCTLQDVLEQCNVPFTDKTNIQIMQNCSGVIDFFVSVGRTKKIEDLIKKHHMHN
ncbi:jg6051 [Pararge aegeria aegeria]|uniref:Jg6051 protein n=2 Tax=Pararge aegeria TaxID=116150 RepID=A0A8S4SLW5_9NEOP|nr:jg6051 [Pararge aegeria aegeria]